MPKIATFGKTDVGLRRTNNEDAFVTRPEQGFCLVADGVGGAAAGEFASRIFAETTLEVFSGTDRRSEKETVHLVQKAFAWANDRILTHVKATPRHEGMGCTAELVAFSNEGFVLGHVGDSRTYRLRKGQLKQLSRDHSFVQDQIDQGLITPTEARNHPMRHLVIRAVGIDEDVALDLVRGKAFPGDVFLLCSDGLTDGVDDTMIRNVLSLAEPLSEKAEKLVGLANSAGGYDNITVALSEVMHTI
ncbi:MAG: Stp1/IreP family PP2C-type Ser/Thr phosphatase [Thermodesulfobacteriota bacterium]|nr:Stp1/IreP family PP2C-type Ser/Thr phosphatase [Thermodesulfobacteriota bacterium]